MWLLGVERLTEVVEGLVELTEEDGGVCIVGQLQHEGGALTIVNQHLALCAVDHCIEMECQKHVYSLNSHKHIMLAACIVGVVLLITKSTPTYN